MASISSLGIGSGLDLNGLLDQLVEAERAPTTNRLNLKEAEVQASISAFGSLKSSLSEFQTTLQDISSLTEFQSRTATSSNDDIFTATAGGDAAVGVTNINVLNLAESHKLASADFADSETVVGTGTLKIEAGGSSFTINVSDGKLSSIRDAINSSEASEKLSATIITVDDGSGGTVSKLVLNAKATGASNAIEVTVTDDDGNDTDAAGLSQLHFVTGDANNRLSELTAATDARITVDGFTVSSSTNEFKDAIDGVTITALKESEDPINNPPETLTIELSKTAVKGKVASFVTTFNGLKDTFNQLLDYNSETGQAGLLNGNGTVRTAESQLERLLYGTVNNDGGVFSYLAQLGITTGENGKLSLDDEAFGEIITNNFNDIGEFFAGEDGLAKKLDSLLTDFLDSDGVIKVNEDGFAKELHEIADDRLELDQRIAVIEARRRQQFAALDGLVSQLNATGTFLTEQLKNTSAIITGITDKK